MLGAHVAGQRRSGGDADPPAELRQLLSQPRVELAGGGKRDEIRRLTGQEDVPILLLDDGDTVVGTKAIVAWAGERTAG